MTDATNYRPLSLTSCICKTMERMINDRLVLFLESIWFPGTRPVFVKTSTNDHFARVESFICDAFVKKEHCVAIFFDLEKAFVTTWKYGIMKDLHDIGLKGRLPNFISNFLSQIFQCTNRFYIIWYFWTRTGRPTREYPIPVSI